MEIYNNITQNLGFEPQNMFWEGFHAKQAPNTNIVTHP